MAAPVEVNMAADLDLPDGYVVEWSAIDPATGADVAGVVVTNVSIFGVQLGTGTGTDNTPVGAYMLVPGPGA